MKLDEQTKEKLREATVAMVLAFRREFLANGGSPLKQWDQIGDRMRAAARTCSSPEEWATAIFRSLQLGSPSKDSSHSLASLAATVRESKCPREWLDLIEREHGYIVASARLEAEKRKAAKEQLASEIDAINGDAK